MRFHHRRGVNPNSHNNSDLRSEAWTEIKEASWEDMRVFVYNVKYVLYAVGLNWSMLQRIAGRDGLTLGTFRSILSIALLKKGLASSMAWFHIVVRYLRIPMWRLLMPNAEFSAWFDVENAEERYRWSDVIVLFQPISGGVMVDVLQEGYILLRATREGKTPSHSPYDLRMRSGKMKEYWKTPFGWIVLFAYDQKQIEARLKKGLVPTYADRIEIPALLKERTIKRKGVDSVEKVAISKAEVERLMAEHDDRRIAMMDRYDLKRIGKNIEEWEGLSSSGGLKDGVIGDIGATVVGSGVGGEVLERKAVKGLRSPKRATNWNVEE